MWIEHHCKSQYSFRKFSALSFNLYIRNRKSSDNKISSLLDYCSTGKQKVEFYLLVTAGFGLYIEIRKVL